MGWFVFVATAGALLLVVAFLRWMMAQKSYVSTDLLGGINQNRNQSVANQCSDALNVWTPNGRVERRPGFRGLTGIRSLPAGPGSLTSGGAGSLIKEWDVTTDTWQTCVPGAAIGLVGTYGNQIYLTLDVDAQNIHDLNLGAAGDWVHGPIYLVAPTIDVANTEKRTYFAAEYYNGTEWVALGGDWGGGGFRFATWDPFYFALPKDIAQVAVNAVTKYWLRFTIRDADLSVGTTLSVPAGGLFHDYVFLMKVSNAAQIDDWNVVALYPSSLSAGAAYSGAQVSLLGDLFSLNDFKSIHSYTYSRTTLWDGAPASFAYIPGSRDLFVCSGVVTHNIPMATPTNGEIPLAQVDTSDFATGPGAPFDRAVQALESTWPVSKFVVAHENRLFAVTNHQVRWSGPAPYHRVWASLCQEFLENDDSATTWAMSAWGRVVIAKQNSFRASLYTGEDAFANPRYTFPRVCGVGCVAGATMRMTNRNELVWLAEDGLYAMGPDFNPRKVTLWAKDIRASLVDRLETLMGSINKGARSMACGINWASKGVYLVSFPTGSSMVNDTTLVWDYNRDSFWIWRGTEWVEQAPLVGTTAMRWQHFAPNAWLISENEYGQEQLFFADQFGRIYQFDCGQTNDGEAIDAYVVTQPLGHKAGTTFTLRSVSVYGENTNGSVAVTTALNDSAAPLVTAVDYDDYHEAKVDTAIVGTDKLVANRARVRSNSFRQVAESVTIKVEHNDRVDAFVVEKIEAEIIPIGRR